MTRFYFEGQEVDVQDPRFFIEKEDLIEQKKDIDSFLEDFDFEYE